MCLRYTALHKIQMKRRRRRKTKEKQHNTAPTWRQPQYLHKTSYDSLSPSFFKRSYTIFILTIATQWKHKC